MFCFYYTCHKFPTGARIFTRSTDLEVTSSPVNNSSEIKPFFTITRLQPVFLRTFMLVSPTNLLVTGKPLTGSSWCSTFL